MRLRNVCPLGAVEVAGRVVEAGEVFEVSDEIGASLLRQPANFQPAEPSWAEPDADGEAYIPLAPSKRERSAAIWDDAPNIQPADEAPEAKEAKK